MKDERDLSDALAVPETVVRQELAPREAWSCGCEGAEKMTNADLL